MGAFEDFVNTELPLRISIAAVPTNLNFPRFTGVGRGVEERTAAQVKSDIGLANVTNDAQLKRSANDFAGFGEKATPVDNDRILIEDSAASYAKKYVKFSKLGGSGGGLWLPKITLADPVANDDFPVVVAVAQAATITKVMAVQYGGNNVVWNLKIRNWTGATSGGNSVWTGDKTTNANNTYTSFDNAAVAQYYGVYLVVTSVSGTVSQFDVLVEVS